MIEFTTNHHRREPIDSWDIPADVRADFDYIDWSACDRGEDSVTFVRAYGQWFDMNDTEPGPAMFGGTLPDAFRAAGWNAYKSETYFSGIVFRYVFDSEDSGEYTIVVGRYFVGSDSE